jgi:hypothetical protein
MNTRFQIFPVPIPAWAWFPVAMILLSSVEGNYRFFSTKYRTLQYGMTYTQVEATLGVPPGDYTGKGKIVFPNKKMALIVNDDAKVWWGRDGRVTIILDAQGKVKIKTFDQYHVTPRICVEFSKICESTSKWSYEPKAD